TSTNSCLRAAKGILAAFARGVSASLTAPPKPTRQYLSQWRSRGSPSSSPNQSLPLGRCACTTHTQTCRLDVPLLPADTCRPEYSEPPAWSEHRSPPPCSH